MIFRTPMPFKEAIDAREVKQILPTELRTDMLSTISPEVRERAMFSAGVTNAEFLQEAHDSIGDLVTGRVDRATKRAGLKTLLGRLGYAPAEGEAGSITDLSSDRRLNLILDTGLQQAQGYGQWKQGQDSAILDQWPANELIRVRDSLHPRDWQQRFRDACEEVGDQDALRVLEETDRMVALKNSRVWSALSRFGTPYAPYDFNSGMDDSDVDRDEAISLGLIDRDTELLPQDRGFNDELRLTPIPLLRLS